MMNQGWTTHLGILWVAVLCGCKNIPTESPLPTTSKVSKLERSSVLPPSQGVSNNSDSPVIPVVLEQPAEPVSPADPPPLMDGPPQTLNLQTVVSSVEERYPLLVSALLDRNIAEGKQLSAWGEFDLGLKTFHIAAPEGFYRTYRNGVALEQPTFGGGYLYGGYKIGDGKFQPWFGERETNEGGEFSAGFGMPLLKDRSIDKRREALFKADLARRAVEPAIQAQFLEFVRVASQTYWIWGAAGQSLQAQQELLKLAQIRVNQIETRVDAGDLPKIARLNNEQLIASRETKVIESQRKLQESAIKLSLFLRDPQGQPIIPPEQQLPPEYPPHPPLPKEPLDTLIVRAVTARPELLELQLISRQVRVELAQAENLLLPKLDARMLAAKDVGAPASSKGDKTPFELEVGLYGEVPLQRREARGKVASAQSKLSQIDVKRQFVTNKVTALVQDAVSALTAAQQRYPKCTPGPRNSSPSTATI